MKVVVLAGGMGTRLSEETIYKPKPMVEIGGRPILWHIMKMYDYYGFRDFVIALGYKSEVIKDYFINYHNINQDLTVDVSTGKVKYHTYEKDEWKVSLIDTGLLTQTGGRIKRVKPYIGDQTFMFTYGDGVANVDLRKVIAFHREHKKLATVTAVRPPARFGSLMLNGNRVTAFMEKSVLGEGWINGGFFVLEPQVMDYISGDETLWEREPLERLAADGQLMAYLHDGFWQAMDAMRDKHVLEKWWESGNAPWKVW